MPNTVAHRPLLMTDKDRAYFQRHDGLDAPTAPTLYRCNWCGNTDAAKPNSVCTRRACLERH